MHLAPPRRRSRKSLRFFLVQIIGLTMVLLAASQLYLSQNISEMYGRWNDPENSFPHSTTVSAYPSWATTNGAESRYPTNGTAASIHRKELEQSVASAVLPPRDMSSSSSSSSIIPVLLWPFQDPDTNLDPGQAELRHIFLDGIQSSSKLRWANLSSHSDMQHPQLVWITDAHKEYEIWCTKLAVRAQNILPERQNQSWKIVVVNY